MIQVKTANWVRVNKTTARRLYQTGRHSRVYFCPVNMNPENAWTVPFPPVNNDLPFDQLVTEYEHYNCTCNETGRYTAFYVPREWYELATAANKEWNPDRAEELSKQLEAWEVIHP